MTDKTDNERKKQASTNSPDTFIQYFTFGQPNVLQEHGGPIKCLELMLERACC